MELTEEQIFDAMGMAAPAAEGAKEQGPAQPAAVVDGSKGAKEQEAAEPAKEEEKAAEPATEKPGVMTEEARREQAAKRRRKELRAAVEQARKEERAAMERELQAVIAMAGISDPDTGAPVNTLEDFRKFQQGQSVRKLQEEIWNGGIQPETLNQAIEDNPSVRAARELMERQERERAAEEEAVFQTQVKSELAEIHRLDDSVSTVEDLLTMPNAQEFYALVQRGYGFYDAYCCLNRDRLYQKVRETAELRAAQAARQQAAANVRGKDHLNAAAPTRGSGAESVPSDEMALFRLFNPGASEAEIQAYYNKAKRK